MKEKDDDFEKEDYDEDDEEFGIDDDEDEDDEDNEEDGDSFGESSMDPKDFNKIIFEDPRDARSERLLKMAIKNSSSSILWYFLPNTIKLKMIAQSYQVFNVLIYGNQLANERTKETNGEISDAHF